MATKDQIRQALKVAEERAAAGDRKAAGYVEQLNKALADTPDPTFTDKAKAVGKSALAGLNDPLLGASQLLARGGKAASNALLGSDSSVTKFFADEQKMYDDAIKDTNTDVKGARDAAGFDGFDVSRMATNIVNPVNVAPALSVAGKATMAGTALAGARAGAIGAGIMPVANTDQFATEKLKQIGIGALGGATVAPAMKALSGAVLKGVNRARLLSNKPDPEDVIQEALRAAKVNPAEIGDDQMNLLRQRVTESIGKGRKIDVGQAARQADFDSLGIAPTKGQISRDPEVFAFERNIQNVENIGGPLKARLIEQNRVMHSILDDASAEADDIVVTGRKLIDEMSKLDDDLRSGVNAQYAAARQAAKGSPDINPTGLASEAKRIVDGFDTDVPPIVKSELQKYGLLGDGMKQNRIFNAEEAESLLQVVNSSGSPSNRSQMNALSQLRNAVKKSITDGLGDGGPYESARKAAAERFALQDALPALQDVVEGTASADKFVNKYIKLADTDKVTTLANNLSDEARGEVKKQISEYLRKAAFGSDAAGDRTFSVQRFSAELGRFGKGRLQAFFSDAEIGQLHALKRVSGYVNDAPALSGVNTSNTTSALANLMGAAGREVPGVSHLGRVREGMQQSAAVRESLSPSNAVAPLLGSGDERLIDALSTGAAGVGRGLLGGGQTP